MLTEEEQKYCMLVVSTGSYLKAYKKLWGDDQPNGHMDLAAREDICARVAELTVHRNQLPVSLADHAERLAQIRDMAVEDRDFGNALKAEVKLGELRGFYVRKVEVEEKQYMVVQLPPALKSAEEWAKLTGKRAQIEHAAIDGVAERVS